MDNFTRLNALANTLADKWAQKYRNGDVYVSDWDLAKEGAHDAMRNAELEYYIMQAILEAARGEYTRGYNDCSSRNFMQEKPMEATMSEVADNPTV